MSRIREYGAEQPYTKLGVFKLRLPFIHYKWSWPEFGQAILMCSTCLGAIPILTEYLGISYELAWSMVIINGLLYNLHSLLGDPVAPGWITPAVPIITAFLSNTVDVPGPERTRLLIALQFLVGLIFLIMGITGWAGKLIQTIPLSIQSGVLFGAGVASLFGELSLGKRLFQYPVAILVGGIIAYFCLFSKYFERIKHKNKLLDLLGKFGMLPAIIVAVVIGPIVGEIAAPRIELGTFIKLPEVGEIFSKLTIFGLGLPSLKLLLAAIPTAIVIYVIAFGDFITSGALLHEADVIRQDEKIDFNPNRSNLISAIRNIVMSIFCPYTQMCGPLWAAVTAAITQRYKEGRQAMDSIYSGVGTFRWSTFLMVSCYPIVSLLKPVLPIALSLTLLVQGYICLRLSMSMCKTDTDRGICGVMGVVLAIHGSTWGLLTGIGLFLLLNDWGAKK